MVELEGVALLAGNKHGLNNQTQTQETEDPAGNILTPSWQIIEISKTD